MIVRRRFRPQKIWPYVQTEVAVVLLLSTAVVVSREYGIDLGVPFLPLGMLGTALAISVGFRNSAAYGRWWEARTAWAAIQSASLQYARLVATFARSHSHKDDYVRERSEEFIHGAIRAHLAMLGRLREALKSDEANAPDSLALIHEYCCERGTAIYHAMAVGVLQGFDSFQLEGALAQLQSAVATCEKICSTPLARQFSVFTTVFVWIVLIATPFCLASILLPSSLVAYGATSVAIAFAFTILDKAGVVTENPFANSVHAIPMEAISRDIERELLRMVGAAALPPRLEAVDGVVM